MFKGIEMAPADPILGLTEAFKADTNPEKINLGVGVYKDVNGQTPILESVLQAEKVLLETETTKGYLGIDGLPAMGKCVRELLFGPASELVSGGRAATAQTPGGTGALRVAADFIAKIKPGAKIHLPDPTWANHNNIFAAANLETCKYPYYNAETKGLNFDAMNDALSKVPAGDVILLHACCHNPSGMDPDAAQWKILSKTIAATGATVLFDFAYQGFGESIEKDAAGIRCFADAGIELLITSSFSKNFSLYNERVGAITLVAASSDDAAAAHSHIKKAIRCNYSNPPAHGGKIVATILGDEKLTAIWQGELTEMRSRINGMRKLFVEKLAEKGVEGDYSFITTQNGMFSFSGLSVDQVKELCAKYSIYIVNSGRINVAGITPSNVDKLCEAIKSVM